MPTHTTLKGVSQAGDSLLSDQLEANVLSFLQWGCLGVGGFFNVNATSASGVYGGDQRRLRLSEDPNYLVGQTWEGFRKDWVWETGVEYPTQPIHVSGVTVNGSFYPSSETGAYAHHVDYPNGRIVFNTPIASSSVVQCEFAYRQHSFTTADAPWWREFQVNSMRVDDPQFLQYGSGAWATLAQNRIQLPAVIVEAVPNVKRFGKQLGSVFQYAHQEMLFHVVTEDRGQMKWLHDTLTAQKEKNLIGFDKNKVLLDSRMPLDADGSPAPSGLMYPSLVSLYQWRPIVFFDVKSSPQPTRPPLWYCTVRATMEVDIP